MEVGVSQVSGCMPVIPAHGKTYAGGLLRVRGQPGLHSQTIPQNKMKHPHHLHHSQIKTNRKRSEENWGHKRRGRTPLLSLWTYYTCWTNGKWEQNSIAFLLACVSKIVLFCFEGARAEFCLPQSPKCWHEPPHLPFLLKMSFSFTFISVYVCVPPCM